MALTRLLVALVLVVVGCSQKKPIRVDAPIHCLRPIKIENFGKPCKPISPSEAICDHVLVQYDCVEYKH